MHEDEEYVHIALVVRDEAEPGRIRDQLEALRPDAGAGDGEDAAGPAPYGALGDGTDRRREPQEDEGAIGQAYEEGEEEGEPEIREKSDSAKHRQMMMYPRARCNRFTGATSESARAFRWPGRLGRRG
jgi:hypothetical protein